MHALPSSMHTHPMQAPPCSTHTHPIQARMLGLMTAKLFCFMLLCDSIQRDAQDKPLWRCKTGLHLLSSCWHMQLSLVLGHQIQLSSCQLTIFDNSNTVCTQPTSQAQSCYPTSADWGVCDVVPKSCSGRAPHKAPLTLSRPSWKVSSKRPDCHALLCRFDGWQIRVRQLHVGVATDRLG